MLILQVTNTTLIILLLRNQPVHLRIQLLDALASVLEFRLSSIRDVDIARRQLPHLLQLSFIECLSFFIVLTHLIVHFFSRLIQSFTEFVLILIMQTAVHVLETNSFSSCLWTCERKVSSSFKL